MIVSRLPLLTLIPILCPILCSASPIGPSRLEKLQAVLSHLQIPAEPDYSERLKAWDGVQTKKSFETILNFLDPRAELQRYLTWNDEGLVVYKDRDTKQVVDYSLSFKADGELPSDPRQVVETVRSAATNNPDRLPLQGLRIALDPGHMGNRLWAVKTGKYVNYGGRYLSEGVINFDVCMLLKRELENLGASTMITRHGLTPVSEVDPATFDLKPQSYSQILAHTDDAWFEELLSSATSESELFRNTDRERHLKHYFSKSARDEYFISGLDLRARADKINAFEPDLTLVIHFDAVQLSEIQNSAQAVRGYIEGDVLPGEASSQAARAQALQALLDGHRWIQSSLFTKTVIEGISDATGVPVMSGSEDYHGERVTKGVYARNLALTRLVNRGIMAYIEVLHYDYAPDFKRLTTLDRHIELEGVKLDYSSRLDDVVTGLKQGILNYVRSMGNRTDNATNHKHLP